MRTCLRFVLIVVVLICTLPIITCAKDYSNRDAIAELEYTDNIIESDNTITSGSGLNMMQFQVNEDSLLDSVVYSTTHAVTFTKEGDNTLRVWVSDKVWNVSEMAEIEVSVDTTPPVRIRFNIMGVIDIPSSQE